MERSVREEIPAPFLSLDVAGTDVGSRLGRQAPGISAGRRDAIEIDVSDGADQAGMAVHTNR